MADLIQTVKEVFWNKHFWLPSNRTWDMMKNNNPDIYKPQQYDMLMPVILCFVICIVRIIFERCVEFVMGQMYNFRSKVKKAPANSSLEQAYLKHKAPSDDIIERLSKQTDLTVRQVERWFRIRRNQDRTPVMKKFCESSWRCFYYTLMFFYGLYTLWGKSFLWDTSYCWKDWPEHDVTPDLYWYYAMQAGFYLALCLSLFSDHKRKDFTEMIVHHMATLGLMFFSWTLNFVRVGSLVLCVHDCVDPLLESAKLAKYLKKEWLCMVLFVGFLLVWVVTRMMLFPFRIINSTLYEAVGTVGMCNAYYVFNGLLITLQILHIIWFYFILLITREILFEGQLKKDSRSSDESISEDDTTTTPDSLPMLPADKLEQNGVTAH